MYLGFWEADVSFQGLFLWEVITLENIFFHYSAKIAFLQKLDKIKVQLKISSFHFAYSPQWHVSRVIVNLLLDQQMLYFDPLEQGVAWQRARLFLTRWYPLWRVKWNTNLTPAWLLTSLCSCRVSESCFLIHFLGIPTGQMLSTTVGIRRDLLGRLFSGIGGLWSVPGFQWLLLTMVDSSFSLHGSSSHCTEHPRSSSHENRWVLQELGQILITSSSPSQIKVLTQSTKDWMLRSFYRSWGFQLL